MTLNAMPDDGQLALAPLDENVDHFGAPRCQPGRNPCTVPSAGAKAVTNDRPAVDYERK